MEHKADRAPKRNSMAKLYTKKDTFYKVAKKKRISSHCGHIEKTRYYTLKQGEDIKADKRRKEIGSFLKFESLTIPVHPNKGCFP